MANQKIPETLAANLAGSLDFTELALIAKGGLVKGIALSAIRAGLLAATATAADASKLGGLSPSSYQLSLVSGTNLKTVGGVSLLGSGDVTVGDMLLGTAQEVTAAKTFDVSTLVLKGSTSGTSTLNAAAVAGTTTFTLPGSSGTLALLSDIPSLSGYETTSHASSTYQTLAGMSGYLTTSGTAADSSKLGGTAAASYALASDLSSYLTTATAASTYQTQAGMSSYLTTASAASTYLALAGGTLTGGLTLSGTSLTFSGNISAPAWTTAGIRHKSVAATLTDTTSSGTVAAAYTNTIGGNTIAASNATVFTDYATMFVNTPAAGSNVTIINAWSIISAGAIKATAATLTGGALTLNGATSGASVLSSPAVAGSATITLPGVTSTLATLGANTFTSLQTITVGAANTGVLASTGYSLTGSDATSMVNLAGTWNTSGTPTAIKLNVTDTASNSASLLLDLQIGGASKFKIRKDGLLIIGDVTNGGAYGFPTAGAFQAFGTDSQCSFQSLIFGVSVRSGGYFAWASSSSSASASTDTALFRDAAGILAQRNAANAQTLRVYNTYTDASNYERGVFDWTTSANVLTIGTQNAGTGSARAISFLVGGTQKLIIGSSSATFSSDFYIDTSSKFGWASKAYLYSNGDGVIILWNSAQSGFGLLKFGGTTSSFPALKQSSATLQVRLADDSANAGLSCSYVKTDSTTVSGLPSAATAGAGARAFVTDASATTFLSTVAGGGANKVPVVSDGTNWIIG